MIGPWPERKVDRCLLAFTVGLALVVVLLRPGGWLKFLALHAVVAAAIVGIAAGARGRDGGVRHRTAAQRACARRGRRFLQLWYPLPCFFLFFEEVGALGRMLQPEWCDRYLLEFEYALLGVHPTLWVERWSAPWLTELMQACYFTYYLLVPALGWRILSRRGRGPFERMMTALAFGYVACYVVYYVFPIEGPYHTLHGTEAVLVSGGIFSTLMDSIERAGRVHGGAFPSAHVVGTIVPWLAAWGHSRRLGAALTPLVAGILAATVYGRYHYVSDVAAGVAVGAAAWAASARGGAWRGPHNETQPAGETITMTVRVPPSVHAPYGRIPGGAIEIDLVRERSYNRRSCRS